MNILWFEFDHMRMGLNVWISLFLVAISAMGQAVTYKAPEESSQWYLSSSIFGCRIVHDIPRYGRGVFFHEAGETLKFFTETPQNPMAPGKAALVVEASQWRPGQGIQDLGYVPVIDNANKPITVQARRATSMMQGLLAGMAPTFTRKSWYSEERVRVQLNSVNFTDLYEDYLDCVATLLPVNFNQVERTRVHFESDKAVLSARDKRKLDKVILYINNDPNVTALFVDGHTDNTGRRIYNRRLSKTRAESVRDYLIGQGIEDAMIRVRYHGERYPVASNASQSKRAENRRTTVRLVQGEVPASFGDENADPRAAQQ